MFTAAPEKWGEEPRPEIKRRVAPQVSLSKRRINMKKQCPFYKCIPGTTDFEIEKAFKVWVKNKEMFTENLALCAQLLCTSCMEIIKDKRKCPKYKRMENQLDTIIVEIEEMIENIGLDPSRPEIIKTIKSLLRSMSIVGEIIRELQSPWEVKKWPNSFYNFKFNVKLLSFFVPVLSRLIEIANAVVKVSNSSSLPTVIANWKQNQADMKEALKFYENLPHNVTKYGTIGTILGIITAIVGGVAGYPILAGVVIVGSVGCGIATYGGQKYFADNFDPCKSEGEKQWEKTMGIPAVSTIPQQLRSNTA